MWIMTTAGMLSIVDKDKDPTNLVVRARQREALVAMFPLHAQDILDGAGTDYRYRLILPRSFVAHVIGDSIGQINYPNFKSAVRDRRLHDAYLRVWQTMSHVSG